MPWSPPFSKMSALVEKMPKYWEWDWCWSKEQYWEEEYLAFLILKVMIDVGIFFFPTQNTLNLDFICQVYGETIGVWLIIAALLFSRIYHPAGPSELCAVSRNFWLLHLFRGSYHLNIAQCWVFKGVKSRCRICDHSSHVQLCDQQWTCMYNKLSCSGC